MDTQYTIEYIFTSSGDNVVSSAELTNYVKQDDSIAIENTLIDSIITSGIDQAQRMTFKQLNTEVDAVVNIDVECASSDGNYHFIIPFANSSIVVDSISAIDRDGDSVTIDSDDYRLKGNTLIMKVSNYNGYRITLELTLTATSAAIGMYKETILAFLGYKYMFRSTKDNAKEVELLDSMIDYKGWM